MLLTPPQAAGLYRHAVENRYAILAINADSHAAVTDALQAARELDAPVIVETSLWQLKGHSYGCGDPLLGVDRYLADLRALANAPAFEQVPVIYHTDHIKGPQTLEILTHAMRSAASSISLDSSELTHEQNIAHMGQLCDFATANGLPATLEMEAGVDDGVTEIEETRSLFGEVEKRHPGYLALWAPGVGTQHGLGDVKAFDTEAIRAHQELASELAGRPIGLALHGSSGLTNDQLAAGVANGVAKVNWSSESLLIRSQALRAYYAESGDKLERGHPEFKVTAMDNGPQSHVSSVYLPRVKERIQTLGGSGHGRAFLQTLP